MMTALRIWSGFMAVIFAAVETHLNLTVYHGKPLPILLPYYVMAAWLLAGALVPRHGWHLLVSAWGVTLGHTYLVYVENLLLRESSSPLVTALRNTTISAALSLALANYCAWKISRQGAAARRSTPAVRVAGLLLAMLVVAGQLTTGWSEAKPTPMVAAYFVLAALLALPVFARRPRAPLVLSIWSVAFGFFYAEFAGFLVFFPRPFHIVAIAGVAASVSLAGVILQSAAMTARSVSRAPHSAET